jgi:hypothetical protein
MRTVPMMRDAIRLPGDGARSGHCGIGKGALTMEFGVWAMTGEVEATELRRFGKRIEGDATCARDRETRPEMRGTRGLGCARNAPVSAMEARREAMRSQGRAMLVRGQAMDSRGRAMSIRSLAIATWRLAIEERSLAIGDFASRNRGSRSSNCDSTSSNGHTASSNKRLVSSNCEFD